MTAPVPDPSYRYLIAEADGITPIYWATDIPYPTECGKGDVVYDAKTDLVLTNDGNSWKVA